MASTEDYYEFTQPTQPIDENTQNFEDEENSNSTQSKLVGTLVKLNGHVIQNFNLYINSSILIGRHRTCEIVIDSTYSSNKHCKIYAVESTGLQEFIVFCEDLSSNGTLWNGKNIGRGNKVILGHGDTLEIKKGNYITFLLKNRILRKSDTERDLDVSSMYQLTDKVLGSGTFAKVKLAIRKDTNEQVAVKIMDKKSLKNPGSIGGGTNYIDEINLLRAFDHPNIVRVFEVQETEKQVYIFMPLISGGDLFDHIIKSSCLSEQESKFITYQMLLALKYLHDRNISHRDVKPENILMDSTEPYSCAFLSDFGMARTINQNDRMQTICGTFQYIAPEIIRTGLKKTMDGHLGYSIAVDCWSLGIVVYAMLSGMLPFSSPDGNDQVLFGQILSGKVDFSSPVWKTISPEGLNFVRRFLCNDPKKRMTIREAFEDAWIRPVLKDLALLYTRKVKKHKNGSESKGSKADVSPNSNNTNSEASSPDVSTPKPQKRALDSIISPAKGDRKMNGETPGMARNRFDNAQLGSSNVDGRADETKQFRPEQMSPPRTPASARRKIRN